eukprot:6758121-Ditylum_brightwellii.AAC.1
MESPQNTDNSIISGNASQQESTKDVMKPGPIAGSIIVICALMTTMFVVKRHRHQITNNNKCKTPRIERQTVTEMDQDATNLDESRHTIGKNKNKLEPEEIAERGEISTFRDG